MKTNRLLTTLAALLLCALALTACKTTATPDSIQNKAKGVTFWITAETLIQHPEWKEYFQVASLEFQTLSTSTNIGMPAIMEIVSQLPTKQLKGERAAIYLTVGTMFLKDEVSQIAVTQPEELRRAVLGAHEGIDLALKMAK